MFKKFIASALLLAGSLMGAQAAPVLSFTPSASSVNVGQSFTLDIRIAGVTDLYGWQLDLGFAPAGLLNASGVTEGDFLGVGTTFDGGTIDNVLGTITFMFDALSGSSGVSGDGLLARVAFQAMLPGLADLSFANVLLLDSNLDTIFFDNTTGSGTALVSITQGGGGDVPEPSTLALIVLALTATGACRRRTATPVLAS